MAGRGQISFHSGAFFIVAAAANPTPLQVATLQETSFDFKASNKELFGERSFAEAVGRGNVKISGKAKSGRFNGRLMNEVFFKMPETNIVAQAKLLALDEPGTIAVAKVTVANGANFLEDLGVQNATTGVAYKRVANAPAVGQYAVNTANGEYSFAAGENDSKVRISYLHKSVAAGAGTLNLTNELAGEAPTFRAIFSQKFQGQTMTLILNAVVSESLAFGFKNEDFAMPDFSFAAQADTLGNVGELSMTSFA